jgi:hypothetical protein
MSSASAVSRVTRSALEELQRQFEALAPRFPNLQHLYMVHLSGTDVPFPNHTRDAHRGNYAMGAVQSGYHVFVHGRWASLRTIRDEAIQVWQSWFKGDGQLEFHALAERTGPQLSAFRVWLPAPSECIEILRRDLALTEDALVLPDEIHRWPKVLHWLGWAGKVMPVERWGVFNGIEMPIDKWDESRCGSRPRTYYSIIDNLFLRPAAALEWMIDRVGDSAFRPDAPSPRSEAHRPEKGRPTDTDEREDRRIAEAWKTKRYKTYEDLGTELGKTALEVKRAVDRHRHRPGKTKAGKSSQYR